MDTYSNDILNLNQLLLIDINELEALAVNFPASGFVHAMLAKRYKLSNDLRYEKQLNKAALLLPDREKLYDFIQRDMATKPMVEEQSLEEEKIAIKVKKASKGTSRKRKASKNVKAKKERVKEKAKSTKSKTGEKPINKKSKKLKVKGEKQESIISKIQEAVNNKEVKTEKAIEHFKPKETIRKEEKTKKEKAIESSSIGTHTFLEWLQIVDKEQKEKGATEEIVVKKKKKKVKKATISKKEKKAFVTNTTENKLDPKLKLSEKENAIADNLAKASITFNHNLATETLAKLYVKQGKIGKAKELYKILSLKYPNKSAYFAAQIEKIEE